MYHLYDVETEEGWVSMIAVLAPEQAIEEGLPSPAVVGTVPRGTAQISPETFSPNPEFSAFLSYVIGKHGADMPGLREQAAAQGDGWIYMVDLRTGDAEEQVESEDILGAFQAADGKIVADSYRANPNHRVLTARGLLEIDDWLYERLVEELLALG
jgi:hypothetical protein